jgi:hypothetical protein
LADGVSRTIGFLEPAVTQGDKESDEEAIQTRDSLGRKKRDPSRGSLGSFTAQKTLVQDDNQTGRRLSLTWGFLPRKIRLLY